MCILCIHVYISVCLVCVWVCLCMPCVYVCLYVYMCLWYACLCICVYCGMHFYLPVCLWGNCLCKYECIEYVFMTIWIYCVWVYIWLCECKISCCCHNIFWQKLLEGEFILLPNLTLKSIRWANCSSRNLRHVVTLHPLRTQNNECLCSFGRFYFILYSAPLDGAVLPTVSTVLPISINLTKTFSQPCPETNPV